jgi:hypothetical protein
MRGEARVAARTTVGTVVRRGKRVDSSSEGRRASGVASERRERRREV